MDTRRRLSHLFIPWLISLFLGATITGCSTVQRARDAQHSDKIPPGERTVTAREMGLNSNTILTVDAAVTLAYTYNPTMVEAGQNLVIASNQLTQAIAGYLPEVDLQASYTRATANSDLQRSTHNSFNAYKAGFSFNQLVYDFGKTPAIIRQAYAFKEAATYELLATENDIAYTVRTSFYEYSKAIELLQVAADTVQQFKIHLEQVQVLVAVGRRIKYDLTKAEVDLGNARLTWITASNNVITTSATLANSLGLAETTTYAISNKPASDIALKFDEQYTIALKKHPNLIALRAQQKAASANIDATIANLFPSFNLNAGYNWAGAQFPLFWNWFGMGQMLGTLFDGGVKLSAINIAVAQFRSARAQLAAEEQGIYLALSQAFAQLEATRASWILTRLIIQQAQENLQLIKTRYLAGKASSVEVTDAEVSLAQARADAVKSRFDYEIAIAQIQHATGENLP